MEPFDVILAVLDQLTDKQKDRLRDLLKVPPPELPEPCKKSGHKFKSIGHQEANWWQGLKAGDKLFCEKCGQVKLVEGVK
jgi:hypothetical protein